MSLRHSPAGSIDRKVLQAVASAIKALETVTGTIEQYDIGRLDEMEFTTAKRKLWGILEDNGYTIDVDTNRLTKAL